MTQEKLESAVSQLTPNDYETVCFLVKTLHQSSTPATVEEKEIWELLSSPTDANMNRLYLLLRRLVAMQKHNQ